MYTVYTLYMRKYVYIHIHIQGQGWGFPGTQLFCIKMDFEKKAYIASGCTSAAYVEAAVSKSFCGCEVKKGVIVISPMVLQ